MPGSRVPVSSGVTMHGLAVFLVDEKQVHAAHLFDVFAMHGIEPDHLVAAFLFGLRLRHQAGGVVAGTLGFAGAARRGAHVVFADPHGDRLDALRKVGAGGRAEQHEQVFARRTHAEERIGGDHQRAQVQALADVLRHPAPVERDEGVGRFEEQLGRNVGHGQARWRCG